MLTVENILEDINAILDGVEKFEATGESAGKTDEARNLAPEGSIPSSSTLNAKS